MLINFTKDVYEPACHSLSDKNEFYTNSLGVYHKNNAHFSHTCKYDAPSLGQAKHN